MSAAPTSASGFVLSRPLVETIRRDGIARFALLVLVLMTGVRLMALSGADLPPWIGSGHVPFLLPILLLSAHLWRLGELASALERRFWIALAVGDSAFLLAEILSVLPGGRSPLTPIELRHTSLAVTYILVVYALGLKPHRPAAPARAPFERLLTWPSETFFVIGCLIYLLIIPMSSGSQDQQGPFGDYFSIVLDGYLCVRLVILARTVKSRRWRPIYLLFAAAWWLMLLLGLYQLTRSGTGAAVAPAPPGWGWLVAVVILVLATRLRHHPFLADRTVARVAPLGEDLSLRIAGKTLGLGLAFALLHIAAYRLGLFDRSLQPTHEALVFGCLVLFGGVALVQHRVFERHAQALWIDRLKFEASLQASGKDLRLMVERQKARSVRFEAERKFRLTFQACPSMLAISRWVDGVYIEVNPAFERVLGYAREEVLGRSARELGLWVDPEDIDRLHRQLDREGELRQLETDLRARSGERRHVLLSAVEIELDGLRCILTIGLDITQRHERLLRLEQQTRLVDGATDAIIGLDADGRIRYWNRGAERLYGWSHEEVVGRAAVAYIDLRGVLPRLLSSDDEWSGELEHVTKEGRREQVDVFSSPVRLPSGAPTPRLVVSSRRDRH